jgi:hypothetical protein
MLLRFTISALAVLLAATPVSATVLQIDFSGVIDELSDDASLFQGTISVGTPFSGQLLYDDTLAPSSSTPIAAQHIVLTPPGSFAAALAGYAMQADALYEIQVQNGVGDAYRASADADVTSGSFGGSGSLSNVAFSILLEDYLTATALASTLLADASLDLDDWVTARFAFEVVDSSFDFATARGPITSLTVTIVPEPATALLLALGCAAMGLTRRV